MGRGVIERARLLDRVRLHVLEHPIIDLSLSELARAIGSNNRMLLYYFGSLTDLLSEAVDGLLDQNFLLTSLEGFMDSDVSVMDRMNLMWGHLSAPEQRPLLRIFFSRYGMGADQPERHAPFLTKTRTQWVDVVDKALRSDPKIVDPRTTAIAIVSVWRGLQIQLIGGESHDQLTRTHDLAIRGVLAASHALTPRPLTLPAEIGTR